SGVRAMPAALAYRGLRSPARRRRHVAACAGGSETASLPARQVARSAYESSSEPWDHRALWQRHTARVVAHAVDAAGRVFHSLASDERLAFRALFGERAGALPTARPDAIAGRTTPKRADRAGRRRGSSLHRGGHSGSPSGQLPSISRFPL